MGVVCTSSNKQKQIKVNEVIKTESKPTEKPSSKENNEIDKSLSLKEVYNKYLHPNVLPINDEKARTKIASQKVRLTPNESSMK